MENDLIRRSDAIQAFDELLKSPYASNKDPFGCGVRDALKLARDMMRSDAPKSLSIPAVDAVEVRHGRWIDERGRNVALDEEACPVSSALCSECFEWLTASDEYAVIGRYCPNCGAKMEVQDG